MKNLYTLQPPYRVRDELMNTPSFYIPNTQSGVKTAAFVEEASLDERVRLFKLAAKDGDLDKAYQKLKALRSDEDDDEFTYSPDAEDDVPIGLSEDSSDVEDDEFRIDEDDDDDEDE